MICRTCVKRIFQLFENNALYKNPLRLCSTTDNSNLTELDKLKSKYSDNELTQVLNFLNNCNETEMKTYGISENQMETLKSQQNEGKTYKLDDYILLDLIKVPQLQNICENVISKEIKKSKKFKPPKSIVTPSLTKAKVENLKTATGLRIGGNFVSWSQLELTGSDCNILNWEYRRTDAPLNLILSEVIEMGLGIAGAIPNSDAYIIEKELTQIKSTQINSANFRYLIRQQQMFSVVITSLLTRNKAENSNETTNSITPNLLYTMRPYAPGQLFGLFLGNETVSSNETVQALIQQQSMKLNYVSSVTASDKILDDYSSADVYKREEMNKSLLLTLTFIELAILKNFPITK